MRVLIKGLKRNITSKVNSSIIDKLNLINRTKNQTIILYTNLASDSRNI
jgi:hypothetical protein